MCGHFYYYFFLFFLKKQTPTGRLEQAGDTIIHAQFLLFVHLFSSPTHCDINLDVLRTKPTVQTFLSPPPIVFVNRTFQKSQLTRSALDCFSLKFWISLISTCVSISFDSSSATCPNNTNESPRTMYKPK